jgi:transaldolase
MAKEGIKGKENILKHYKDICDIVDGDVSAEVISTDYEEMIKEGQELAMLDPQIVIKIPMIEEGIKAIRYFSDKGIKTNCTLIFSVGQALIAAQAGATYVSPFIGRLDDSGEDGILIVADIVDMFEIQKYNTQVLAASIRNKKHIEDCAMIGADVVTAPLDAIRGLIPHPLTETGLKQFLADHSANNS